MIFLNSCRFVEIAVETIGTWGGKTFRVKEKKKKQIVSSIRSILCSFFLQGVSWVYPPSPFPLTSPKSGPCYLLPKLRLQLLLSSLLLSNPSFTIMPDQSFKNADYSCLSLIQKCTTGRLRCSGRFLGFGAKDKDLNPCSTNYSCWNLYKKLKTLSLSVLICKMGIMHALKFITNKWYIICKVPGPQKVCSKRCFTFPSLVSLRSYDPIQHQLFPTH